MARNKGKMLIPLFSVFILVILISTATTTVAAGDWGKLSKNDTMTWKITDPNGYPGYYTENSIKVKSIDGKALVYIYSVFIHYPDWEYSYSGESVTTDKIWYLYSQSYLEQWKSSVESETGSEWTTADYEWEGKTCTTHYVKQGAYESWIDQNTGILLAMKYTSGGTTHTTVRLTGTNANLATGPCLGTLLIVFVSVATLVTYSLVQYQKKKKE